MKFSEFDLHEKLLEAISYMGFETATPIQEQAMPEILAGKDVIGCAQTGTGKTAAFLLPILDMIEQHPSEFIQALIIVPTRELALQIDGQIQALGYFTNTGSLAVYGGGSGQDWEQQKKGLKKGADIIVATPGKLKAHLEMGYVNFNKLKYLILDEADRMLDMGFREDILGIVGKLPKTRQTLLFSATLAPEIKSLASKMLKDPVEITLALSKPAEGVLQAAYLIVDHQKAKLIRQLIHGKPNYKSILVFSSTKKKVSEIVQALSGQGYEVKAISSDLEQSDREKVLQQFRARNIRVLVATDVLSRGIDIADIDLVINYDIPKNAEDYVHRVGRTARAATQGVAITLVNADDKYSFGKIEKLIGNEIPKVPLPEGFHPPQSGQSQRGRQGGRPKRSSGNRWKGKGNKRR